MRAHGRPVLAAFAGFFLGLGIGLLLLTLSVVPLDSKVLVVLPILFLVLGIVWALWAPLGRGETGPGEPPPA